VHELALDFGDVVDFGCAQKLRHQALSGRRNLGPDTIKIFVARGDDSLCNGLTAMAAHRLVDTIDIDTQVQFRGYRQATMKTIADTDYGGYRRGFDRNLVIISFGDGRLQINISTF
jgi:hypothetical protein